MDAGRVTDSWTDSANDVQSPQTQPAQPIEAPSVNPSVSWKEPVVDTVSEGATASEGATTPEGATLRRSPRLKKVLLTTMVATPQYIFSAVTANIMPPAAVANVGTRYAAKKDTVKRAYINELALLSEEWDDVSSDIAKGISAFSAYVQPDLSDELGSYTVTDMQPHILQAKASKRDADNPSYTQAMNSPNADKWYEAAQIELKTLEDINAWSLVKREPWMKVLPMTWAFKLKRFPDGLAKKFKARFCVRGDRQIEGIDFFETWAPVVQWTTVRAMMILAAKQKMFTAQADITAAFVHAPLAENEHIYVEQPKGFVTDKNLVLKLNRSVYGIRQAPRNFFQYLVKKLDSEGLKQSEHDTCLFIGAQTIVICYVDDLLFFSKSENDIDNDKIISNLHNKGVQICEEGSAEGFLGVSMNKECQKGQFSNKSN